MKHAIGVFFLFLLTITGTTLGQTVTTVPSDSGNNRFGTEYFSVIRPGLSLNGFDNTGDEDKGLGLKQVLNLALAGDTYINGKLDKIFETSKVNLIMNNPSDDDIYENSRIAQYTAFEALASYVLEHTTASTSLRDSTSAPTLQL